MGWNIWIRNGGYGIFFKMGEGGGGGGGLGLEMGSWYYIIY